MIAFQVLIVRFFSTSYLCCREKDQRKMCDRDLWTPEAGELTFCYTRNLVGVLTRNYGRNGIKKKLLR